MKRLVLTLLTCTTLAGSAWAETVYVTAMTSNCVSTTVCGSGANFDYNLVGYPVYSDEGGFGAYTSALAGTADKVKVPGSRYHSNAFSNSTPDLGIVLAPSLAVTGGVYKVFHVFSSTAGNVSTNIIVGVTNVDGCTLSWTNTDKFQRSFGQPSPQVWQLLGYLTNNADTSFPRIRFYFVGGEVNAGSQNRLIIEQFKFVYYDPCTDVPGVGVAGPLSTNVNQVVVSGVSATATNLTVYQDNGAGMVVIGTKTTGVVAGNNTVDVSGLEKGARVAATQTINGVAGCQPQDGFGILVGGGANPSVRVALNIRENTALTGPVGAAGSGGIIHFLGASGILSGGAPADGLIVNPSNDWQTVSFTNGVDYLYTWFGTDSTPGTWDGEFGALDGIAFACEGDNGPFDIYLDDLENGTNGVVQGWEAAATGAQAVGFSQPSFSGTTSGNLITAPNISQVVDTAAYSGRHSLRVRWQFQDVLPNQWLRLVTSGATPVANPQLQSTEPISFKILLLPVGAPLPQPPAPGRLSINLVAGETVLNWNGSYPLQSSTNVLGAYVDVGVLTGPYTNSPTAEAKYFRLRGN